MNRILDTWASHNYKCIKGETLVKANYTCVSSIELVYLNHVHVQNTTTAITTCRPILDAFNSTGVFNKCRVMSDTEISVFLSVYSIISRISVFQFWYNDCIHTVCNEPTLMCTEFKHFVDACSRKLRPSLFI